MDQKLSTFLTLCSTMNYRRAADALHLTQPAVTKQIQALEAQYGVKLFSYDERKLRKTPQGEILERYAISLQYNDAELTRLLAEKPKTLLRIGATKSIGDYILIPEIRRYLEMPDNELYFTVDNTAHLLAQLEAGELDFVILEGIFDKRRYDHFLLRAEPYIVKAKLFCPEIAGLFCRIAGLFCHDSRANLSLKPVCFGIAIS